MRPTSSAQVCALLAQGCAEPQVLPQRVLSLEYPRRRCTLRKRVSSLHQRMHNRRLCQPMFSPQPPSPSAECFAFCLNE